jgi:uncharacterized membrane protein YfcA
MPFEATALILQDPTTPNALLFLGLLGLIVGFLSGLLGIGGGLQMVPGLILIPPALLGGDLVSIQAATGIAAVQALASSMSSTYVHIRNKAMKKRLVLLFGVPSVLGACGGAYFSATWSRSMILSILMVALTATLVLGLRKYLQVVFHKNVEEIHEFITDFNHLWQKWWLIVPFSTAIGGLAGIVGMGGAVFLVPFMTELLKMPVRQAMITGTGVVILTSLGTVLGKSQVHVVPWKLALGISAIAFVGGWLGAKAQGKLHNKHLRLLHLLLVTWAMIETLRKIFGSP